MIRIGIVGSDNSHAQAFPSLTNLQDQPADKHVDGAQVVAIWGRDPARTQEVATAAKIPTIVSDPAEMLGKVDAAMVVFRHGGLHRQYAEPFIRAGIPTFVDKPFAVTVADAQAMVALAEETGTPITSFSTLRYDTGFRGYLEDLKSLGTIRTAIYTTHANRDSEYGGLIFYAIHAVEMMMAAHGPGIQEVRAHQHGPNFIATLAHKDGVLLAVNGLATSHGFTSQAYADSGHKIHQVTGHDFYIQGLKTFLEMVRTGVRPIAYAEMVESIRVASAIETSLQTGQPVTLQS